MYIPLNQKITNLSTRGGEYETLEGVEYIGPYWKTSTGKYFSKSPNDPTSVQLLPKVNEDKDSPQPLSNITSYSILNVDDLGESQPNSENSTLIENFTIVEDYLFLQDINYEDQTSFVPSQSYPTPTENDYKVGNFKRYFCVKVNENSYLELDKKTYDKLSSKNSNWAYELYTPFQLIWYITGEESQVENTNKNLVLIREQRSNRRGLKEFLKENYTKFYKPQ